MDKIRILLVDDDQKNIEALSQIISDDVEVHSFLKASDALASMGEHKYGFAVLDLQMSDMSGLELSKLIRGFPGHSHLPIIFLTNPDFQETITQDHVKGAVDFLIKPLNPGIVKSKVRMFVELERQKKQVQIQLRELEKLRVAAETATVAKSLFLANMSHEIRTPLAAVMGFADLIARGEVSATELDECAASIRRNGNILMRLIDDILDLSKIEANHVELEMVNFSLKELLEDTESTLSFRAREKGIGLIFNQPQFHLSGHVSDPIRVKQILLNIVGNAIKFTSKGKVQVDVTIESVSESQDKLTIVVQNDGIGITKEQAARLFQPFEQAEVTVKRKFGGSGLGLVISRQLAQAMGGDVILLKSEVDVGTEFQITLLLERSKLIESQNVGILKTTFEAAEITANFQGKLILAVDDARDNLVLLEMFLRGTNAKITLAKNGLEAVELSKKHKYDVILMDIQMPKMDGIEATTAIRSAGNNVPILALTAYTTKVEYERCREAGCNDVLIKPISRSNLIKGLIHYLLAR